ncbi:MAG: ATP:cob(I)alamin adenosyltransferase, partial [Acidobacteria bacterium]|nr:ATP:cob(I)alamin adenosyltransferase [Acidobacteriota bacterium]
MALASLAAEYRIPKREISVEITILGQSSSVIHRISGRRAERVVVHLFLSERAQMRDGVERLSDLLNSPGEFLPAMEPPHKVVFLNKEALMVLTAAAEAEFPAEELSDAVLAAGTGSGVQAEFTLQDGTEIRGRVGFVMPEGKRRLVDFLNLPESFF